MYKAIRVIHNLIDLDDVNQPSVSNKKVLQYNASTQQWDGIFIINEISVAQTTHGFIDGQVIRLDSNTNLYTLAQSDNEINAEVIGIVNNVTDINNFSYISNGLIINLPFVAQAGVTYFLSNINPGAFTTIPPQSEPEVIKPLLIGLGGTTGIFYNFRGDLIIGIQTGDVVVDDVLVLNTASYVPTGQTGKGKIFFNGSRLEYFEGLSGPLLFGSPFPTIGTGNILGSVLRWDGVNWTEGIHLVTLPTNGFVGIGTSQPQNILSVSGQATIGEDYVQWAAPSNGLIVEGRVGIGTTDPNASLHVISGSPAAIFMGNVGINTTIPAAELEIVGSFVLQGIPQPSLSPLSHAQLYFDVNTNKLRFSQNAGVYVDITTGAGGALGIGNSVAGGTPGSILFVDNNSNLGQDNVNLFWDEINTRLGIGITVPDSSLQVAGKIHTNTLQVGSASTSGWLLNAIDNLGNVDFTPIGHLIYQDMTPGSVVFVGAGKTLSENNTRFNWDNINQRLGIGAAASAVYKVLIVGSGNTQTAASLRLFNTIDGSDAAAILEIDSGSGIGNSASGYLGAFNKLYTDNINHAGRLVMASNSDALGLVLDAPASYQDIQFYASSEDVVMTLVNGQVGLATTNPVNLLDVKGNVGIGTYASIYTAPVNGMIISGNVGIGISSPDSKLQVAGKTHTDTLQIGSASTSGYVLTAIDSLGNADWRVSTGSGGSGNVGIGTLISLGTPGSVLFVGTASTLSEDNDNLFWDNTLNRLGIGTHIPAANLHIFGSINPYIEIQNNNPSSNIASITRIINVTTNFRQETEIQYQGNFGIVDTTTASNIYRLLINSSGLTGINTSETRSVLEAWGNPSVDSAIIRVVSTDSGIGSTHYNALAITKPLGIGQTYFSQNIKELVVAHTADSNTYDNYFGLGGDNAARIYVNLQGGLGTTTKYLIVGTIPTIPLIFGTNNIERMRILETGNIGIGTTIPQSLLDINGKLLTRQLQVGTASTVGWVLTATDSLGNVDWKVSTGTGGGGGSGSVGIGTSVSGGTPGSVLFVGIGSTLSEDNNNLFWDNTNKRLGINTTTPDSALNVYGKFHTNTIQVGSASTIGWVLTSIDALGNAIFQPIKKTFVLVLCAAFTPTATGVDVAEYPVPFKDSNIIVYNLNRIVLRLQTLGGINTASIEKFTGTAAFSSVGIGTVTATATNFEGTTTTGLGTFASGEKLRFNVVGLGTGQNWTLSIESKEQ